MEVTLSDLQCIYSGKSDQELLSLHGQGTLTEMAYEALEAELAKREISAPPRPRSFPPRTTQEESVRTMRLVLPKLSSLAVLGVAAPVVNGHWPDHWRYLAYLVVIGAMFVFMRGFSALISPVADAGRSRAVILGGVLAALLLVMAPESIRLSLVNHASSPKWSAFAALSGAVVAAVYLLRAYLYWRDRRKS